jgi:hypothetical protein
VANRGTFVTEVSVVCTRRNTPGLFVALAVLAAYTLLPCVAAAQGLTGALIGNVKDQQGGALLGAVVRITSPALIGSQLRTPTNEKGQLRFPFLPLGLYALDIEMAGFATYHEKGIRIGAGATIERTVVLRLAQLAESVNVQGAGSRIEARNSGLETRFGSEDLRTIPTGRFSMFDLVKNAPGVSPTSASGTTTTVSATSVSVLGSSVNENQFLIDGTISPAPAAALPAPSRASTSSRRCRSNRLARQPNSGTCRVR